MGADWGIKFGKADIDDEGLLLKPVSTSLTSYSDSGARPARWECYIDSDTTETICC